MIETKAHKNTLLRDAFDDFARVVKENPRKPETILEMPDMTYWSSELRNEGNETFDKLESLVVALEGIDNCHDTETIIMLEVDCNCSIYLDFYEYKFRLFAGKDGFDIEMYDRFGGTVNKLMIDNTPKLYAFCQLFERARKY